MEKRGFTLIELVIALAVLVIGLVGVIAVIPMGQRAAKDAAIVSHAAMLAVEKMEEVKGYGYEAVATEPPPFPLTGETDGMDWEVQIGDVLISDYSQFTQLPAQNFKKIYVTVRYKVGMRERSDTFRSFIARF